MLAPGTANSETLLKAVRKKNPARVEVLPRELADPNYRDAYGKTALMVAAEKADLRSLKALLAS